MQNRFTSILRELEAHAPFTLFGAFTGIALMLLFRNLEHETTRRLFYVFHPSHVILSAIVTASMFKLHTKKPNFFAVLAIGYVGSIGIATVSDSLIPYIGEVLLGMHAHKHIGFIECWYIVNPSAILGVLIAYFRPRTKFPHAGHVLLSTWASSFHMIMAMGGQVSALKMCGSFVFLFLAVWLPCCISDIVFPLLFVRSDLNPSGPRRGHGPHSHPHINIESEQSQ